MTTLDKFFRLREILSNPDLLDDVKRASGAGNRTAATRARRHMKEAKDILKEVHTGVLEDSRKK
jgi:hypothetical protein